MKLWPVRKGDDPAPAPRYPGIVKAMDGSAAVVAMETAASEAAGAYPITPSTQMGEGWAAAVAEGKQNVFGRRLLFFEPEGEHAAAAVTAGMSMAGLRATNFSSGQGIVYMHESLYPAVGKRLTYVLNIAARALTKHALNVHAGHDDYHAVDDTGFFQLFAKDVQEAADLNLIAHRIAELSLNPGIIAQDGFLTSHVIETLRLPEPELIKEYLGDPADVIDSPTPAQRLVFGARRRRIPESFDLDYPSMLGVVQNQDAYEQGVAAQRPFYFEHIADLADRAFEEFASLTNRRYARVGSYLMEDAEYVILGQGSVIANAEAVADFMRQSRGVRLGVVNLRMFRPFPADLLTQLLAGRKGVVVLERTDQPLAADAPLLREVRASMAQALENGRASGQPEPFAGLRSVAPNEMPDFFSGCFGLGSRDLQPGDLVAAVENMLPNGARRRQFYLGIDFLRKETRLPKLQIWQEQLADAYPGIESLALRPAGAVNLLPASSIAVRIHSIGGWGAITMGKNLAMTAFELFGLDIKANPKYGSEKKGQPTTFYAVLAREPIRLNGELKHVDVVLSPDPNVFRHSNPLSGLADGGVFVLQSDRPESSWANLPSRARKEIEARRIHFYTLDAFRIAAGEASDADLRYRMQGAAFLGAFFKTSPLLTREGKDTDALFVGIQRQLQKKFGHRGGHVVDDNLRVIRRGFDEVRAVDAVPVDDVNETAAIPPIPALLDEPNAAQGIGNPGRFWEQVCGLCAVSQDGLADPFAAIGAIPAATGAMRDLSGSRLEIPEFVAANCTGCAQCWVQCPDAAIPALVNSVEDVIGAAIDTVHASHPVERLRQLVKPLGKEIRRALDSDTALSFPDALAGAFGGVRAKLGWDEKRLEVVEFVAANCTGCAQCWVQCPDAAIPALVNSVEDVIGAAIETLHASHPVERLRQLVKPLAKETRRALDGDAALSFADALPGAFGGVRTKLDWDDKRLQVLDAEFAALRSVVSDMRFARTRPFYDVPESKQKGTGGLLSITINPESCKGCNLCVAVCPDQALVTVKQDDDKLARLRRNWDFWQRLPDTADRYVNVAKVDEGIGVLSSLLLKKATYRSMVGGDGACMGCGEKTSVHLILSAVHALMGPRVDNYVARLDALIAALDEKARQLLASDAKLDSVSLTSPTLSLPIDDAKRETIAALTRSIAVLRDLRWRYVEGPGGKGRARLGMANSTGCSSVWGSTYPYNPYPFPWVNHLFQDAPSVAIGIFEAHMRKMADGFIAVRRAQLQLEDRYERDAHEAEFSAFDWTKFDDDEFAMCPPIIAMGGDGAMLDIGFQNLSRLLASGKPVRVVVLDTQVYSNTGGQACTSGFTGQIADMSAYGAAHHGKVEARKELALIAIAHRGAFVHQSSQASPSHLMAGVLRGLQKRRPVLFNIYTPCPVEHGLADNSAQRAARLALESRAFPFLTYDPDAGESLAECLTLDGNPAADDLWPAYTLAYTDDDGSSRTMELPLTIADWAATEGRFGKHFREVPREAWSDEMLPFHEYLRLTPDDRSDRVPFIWTVDRDQRLRRLRVAPEIAVLAEERLRFWSELRQLAGEEIAPPVRDRMMADLEQEYERKATALRAEFERKLTELKRTYPTLLARRLAEGLLRSAGGHHTVSELLTAVERAGVPAVPVTQGDMAATSARSVSATSGTLASGAAQSANGAGVAAPDSNGDQQLESGASRATLATAVAVVADDDLSIEASIDSARCTTCNECTNLNSRLFAYNTDKQAYIKDAKGGTFAQLVQAAEKCPVSAIHPGTPLNPKERDIAKWIERAKPFN